MVSLRVPPPKDGPKTSITLTEEAVDRYDQAFAQRVLEGMLEDPLLRLFIIRMRYECEVVKSVIHEARAMDLLELEDIVENLTTASDLNLIAKYDTEFHRRLFAIVGDMEFFKWWRGQSKTLNTYMTNFWKSVGYHTTRYQIIIDIHARILEAIKENDEAAALDWMEKHFAFVVIELMGSLYETGRD